MVSEGEDFLKKLDEALLEGRISEETYRELKARYEAERGATKSAEAPGAEVKAAKARGRESFLDRIKESLRASQLRGEIRSLERKIETKASKAGLRLYELVRSGQVSISDPEIESVFAEMDALNEEKRKKEEELKSL